MAMWRTVGALLLILHTGENCLILFTPENVDVLDLNQITWWMVLSSYYKNPNQTEGLSV